MITAIDTNVLLDIVVPSSAYYEASVAAVQKASDISLLVICDVVYAELSVSFDRRQDVDGFLALLEIQVRRLDPEALFEASRAGDLYRKRGGKRDRILPDFMIGAHAMSEHARLLSRDKGFFGKLFPLLEVFEP